MARWQCCVRAVTREPHAETRAAQHAPPYRGNRWAGASNRGMESRWRGRPHPRQRIVVSTSKSRTVAGTRSWCSSGQPPCESMQARGRGTSAQAVNSWNLTVNHHRRTTYQYDPSTTLLYSAHDSAATVLVIASVTVTRSTKRGAAQTRWEGAITTVLAEATTAVPTLCAPHARDVQCTPRLICGCAPRSRSGVTHDTHRAKNETACRLADPRGAAKASACNSKHTHTNWPRL